MNELKAMVIARGGNLTSEGKAMVKEELQVLVRAFLSVEKENTKHTVYFDRSRNNNGIFANIDTSERKTIGQILDSLSHPEPSLQNFFGDLRKLNEEGKFIDDFTTISLQAPEVPEEFIQQSFIHVGESKTQKTDRIAPN